jgi:hypothetical protein
MKKKNLFIISKYFTDEDFMKYLDNNKYCVIKKEEAFKKKFIHFIYFDCGSGTPNKKNKLIIYKINTNYLSALELNEPDFSNKSILNNFVKNKDKKCYKKYFVKQYTINDVNKLINNKLYIVKPVEGFAGVGVKVFNSTNKIKDYIKNFKVPNNKKYIKVKNWIIEDYINNPLLINEKKFHMRLILLLTLKNNISKIFLHKYAEILPAKHKYNTKNMNIHIHNTHGNTSTSSEKMLFPSDFEKIFGKVKRKMIQKQIKILFKTLKKINLFNFNCYENGKNGFEFYGVDIIITDKFKIKCLEINSKPGLPTKPKYTLSYMSSLINGLLDLTLLNKDKNIHYIEI